MAYWNILQPGHELLQPAPGLSKQRDQKTVKHNFVISFDQTCLVTFRWARKWPNICQVKSLPYQLYNIIKSSLTSPLPAPFQKCTYSPGRHKIHATFLLNFDLRSFLAVNVNSSLRYCKNFVESMLQYRVLRYEYFRQCPRNHLFLFIFPPKCSIYFAEEFSSFITSECFWENREP